MSMEGFDRAMSNNLLLTMLSSAGTAIAPDNQGIANMNAFVQKSIGAQSQAKSQQKYMQMLAELLKGGAKMNLDAENISIKAPISSFGGKEGFDPLSRSTLEDGTSASSSSSLSKDSGGVNTELISALLNPSSSPAGPSGADLAGLSSQDVAQALSGALGVEDLKQRTISDIANQALQSRQLDIAEGRAMTDILESQTKRMKELREIQDSLRTSPLEVPGLGPISAEDWKSLDTKTKAYAYYAFDSKQRGEKPLSYNEWAQQSDPESIYQIFKLAEEDSKFKKFFFEQKEAGATKISIGEKVETAEKIKTATDKVERQSMVRAPDYHRKVKDNLAKDVVSWNSSSDVKKISEDRKISAREARDIYQKLKVLQTMDSEVRAAFSDHIVERRIDGWYVDGKLEVRNPYYAE